MTALANKEPATRLVPNPTTDALCVPISVASRLKISVPRSWLDLCVKDGHQSREEVKLPVVARCPHLDARIDTDPVAVEPAT
jgi:hypothetical protein